MYYSICISKKQSHAIRVCKFNDGANEGGPTDNRCHESSKNLMYFLIRLRLTNLSSRHPITDQSDVWTLNRVGDAPIITLLSYYTNNTLLQRLTMILICRILSLGIYRSVCPTKSQYSLNTPQKREGITDEDSFRSNSSKCTSRWSLNCWRISVTPRVPKLVVGTPHTHHSGDMVIRRLVFITQVGESQGFRSVISVDTMDSTPLFQGQATGLRILADSVSVNCFLLLNTNPSKQLITVFCRFDIVS